MSVWYDTVIYIIRFIIKKHKCLKGSAIDTCITCAVDIELSKLSPCGWTQNIEKSVALK